VGTLARGCGDMTMGQWRWESHHHTACYSAGWGVEYAKLANNTLGTDKKLLLWGGVPFGGGGDCAVTISDAQLQELSDYTVLATLSPRTVVNGPGACKSGMVGVAGRIQGTSAFCSGYLLALVLNNGEAICGDGSYLQLFLNNRGAGCNGSEAMTLLASEPVDIAADLGGNFSLDENYVVKLCFSGSDIYGGVWSAEDWEAGGSALAELSATDGTYTSGTFGLYEGSSHADFDNVMASVGGGCVAQGPVAMEAELDFDPNTLNTKSNGKYVTCYIELPEGFDPMDIDVATLMLNDAIPAEPKPTNIGDYDEDGIEDRMVKFDREDLVALLTSAANQSGTSGGAEFSWNGAADPSGTSGGAEFSAYGAADASGASGGAEFNFAPSNLDTVGVWVSGFLTDGTAFVGRDTIRVMSPGGSEGSLGSGGALSSGSALTVTPSPVKGRASIGFEVRVEGYVRLCIFDAAGRRVATLASGQRGVGNYDVTWDRSSDDGRRLSPGVYFVKLDQPGGTDVQKMMVVK
jgi:hypothetical protein